MEKKYNDLPHVIKTFGSKKLIGVDTLREEYGLGRDLARRIIVVLPHVQIGRAGSGVRRLVLRHHVDQLLQRAGQRNLDLWQISHPENAEYVATLIRECDIDVSSVD